MQKLIKQIFGALIICTFCVQIAGPVPLAFADETNGGSGSGSGTESGSGTSTSTGGSDSVTPETLNLSEFLVAPGQENQPTDSISSYILRFINFLSLLIGSFAILAIIVGGVFMLIAGGREEMITRGKDIVTYSITGLVVALVAYFLVAMVQSLFY